MRRIHAIGFTLYCLLAGSEWLIGNTFSVELPELERFSLHLFLLGLLATGISWKDHAKTPQPPLLPLIAAGILLLGLPALLTDWAHGIAIEDGTTLYALAPLFVVIFFAAISNAEPSYHAIRPALIGFLGTLLVLLLQIPVSARGAIHFAAIVLAMLSVAAGSVWVHEQLCGQVLLPSVAMIFVSNALLLGAAAYLSHPSALTREMFLPELLHLLVGLPQLLLLLWLVRELDPVRLSSRFILVPLLSTAEAVCILHPPFDLRMALGVVLMTTGGLALLFSGLPPKSNPSIVRS